MAIKAGNIVHVGNETVVIDRIQTAGPGNLNIPTEKIYELGNYLSVATIRDIPDLTFSMDSLDVSTEIEVMLSGGGNPATGIDLSTCVPIDIASQFKPGISATSPYAVISSVALPFLYMESMSYKFGLRDNAQQSVSLKGDSIYYNPGSTYVQTVVGSNTANQVVATAQPAYAYTGDGSTRRVLSVTVGSNRLTKGADYTEVYGTITAGAAISTITVLAAVPATSSIRIIYSSPTAKSYLQAVHATTAVKPAAVRGKDIDVYVGGYTSPYKWGSVQSVNMDWRATLEKDEEFGNYYATSQGFDVPTVNGAIEIKPTDPAALLAKIRAATGVSDPYAVLGAQSSAPLEMNVVVKDPTTAAVLKRFKVPDARFTIPGYSGRVQTKLNVTLNFESDGGTLVVLDN